MTGLAIVDTETVGLNARIHGIWEVALILRDPPDKDGNQQSDRELVWQLPVDLSLADLDALRISHYYQRRWDAAPPMPQGFDSWYDEAVEGYPGSTANDKTVEHHQVPLERMHTWATRFASLTAGRILVGAVPSFDEKRLNRLLREFGVAPAWHYRPICVETLAVGYLAGQRRVYNRHNDWYLRIMRDEPGRQPPPERVALPWSSTTVTADIGLQRRHGPDIHTALGDARWARDLWVKIMEDA